MKYLEEYREATMVRELIRQVKDSANGEWNIMEICGGQTHSLVKNGIIDLLPENINIIHGPGCPVCVTPQSIIDRAITLASQTDIILCSYGDMLRIPGSKKSLLEVKALGADVRIVYSPLEAVRIASEMPDKQVVFFAVGFETTAPANALAVVQASASGLENFSILSSHVLVPPAIEAILSDPDNQVDAFLAAGHVCTVMGYEEYPPICEQYRVPIIITGFEPVDLVQGILMAVRQLERGEYGLENQYSRMVDRSGNLKAQEMISEVYEVSEQEWRGIGTIPQSGLVLNEKYESFDAGKKYGFPEESDKKVSDCIAGEVLKGQKKPIECPRFGNGCNPESPLGAPMVSSEGACAAYYHHRIVESI